MCTCGLKWEKFKKLKLQIPAICSYFKKTGIKTYKCTCCGQVRVKDW